MDFIAAHPKARPFSTSRIFTSRCAIRRKSGAACATSTRAASTSASSSSSVRRYAPSRKKLERSHASSNCARPIWWNWSSSCAKNGADCPAARPTPARQVLQQLARSLQGLTLDEARYALRRALAASPQLGPESIPALLEEKRLLVNRSGTVEFIAEGGNMGEIGGLEGLKKWLIERRKLFRCATP